MDGSTVVSYIKTAIYLGNVVVYFVVLLVSLVVVLLLLQYGYLITEWVYTQIKKRWFTPKLTKEKLRAVRKAEIASLRKK